ncbi:DUF1566 domain-containing protein [Isoalcanivorax indicus]|uniref:Lcl C-terminal domain-containing protein n=1 Tax=Isoalcanivorax indicus TaxID=2202653 RepID=UPI0013C4BDD4|nr:DUF1566 domain-containing protein [Isoalcanivorax indicus]
MHIYGGVALLLALTASAWSLGAPDVRIFTKLDRDGEALEDSAAAWDCARDNITGLVWEVKVNDAGDLRHREHTYTWYSPGSSADAGEAGAAGESGNSGSCNGTLSRCDTHAYVQAVNALEEPLCGARDWRLPSAGELHSIIDLAADDDGQGDDALYFRNMAVNPGQWWSTSLEAGHATPAWCVRFYPAHFSLQGSVSSPEPSTLKRVLLVRGGLFRIKGECGAGLPNHPAP